jgi:hypothetical protein
MGAGATFAIVAFGLGVLCLLGWLYATTENPRSWAMLKKSLLLFALPIMFAPAALFQLSLGMWALIAFEEGLKSFASTREDDPTNKFWLVALFGIGELTLDKPLWGLVLTQSGETWDRLSLIGLAYSTALPALMHAVTAAIYAFTSRRWLWAAFTASWIIHAAFNGSVDYFGLSPLVALTQTAILTGILAALFAKRRRALSSSRS